MTELTEHAARNRALWDAWAADYAAGGRRAWAEDEPHWDIWHLPDAQVGALGDMSSRGACQRRSMPPIVSSDQRRRSK